MLWLVERQPNTLTHNECDGIVHEWSQLLRISFSPNHLHLRSIYAHHLLYMLRVHRQYSSGTAAGQRLLFGGMYGQKGYVKEQPVPVACGVHQIREFTWSDK